MPCGVTANLIEVRADGSVRVSGTFVSGQGGTPRVQIQGLTVSKQVTTAPPNWSVVFSGAEITGDLVQFRKFCGADGPYTVNRSPQGGFEFPCEGSDIAPVVCPESGQCPTSVTGTARVGDCVVDRDGNRNRPVTFTLEFSPPIPQGALAQVSWAFGGENVDGVSGEIVALSTTQPVSQHSHSTAFPPRPPSGLLNPCSYSVTATVIVVVDGALCNVPQVPICLNVDSCLPCPGDPARNRPPATLTVTTPKVWCAPPQAGQATTFAVAVNFPADTPSPPAPSAFDWAVTTPGGETFLSQTVVASATTADGWRLAGVGPVVPVDLSQPGDYSVGVAVKFPPGAGLPTDADGTPSCNVTAADGFRLDPCDDTATCPSITSLTATPSCADPAAGQAANVSFAVTTTDPSGLLSDFAWNFGDPASGGVNQATTSTPNATHSYSGTGDFIVTVQLNSSRACAGGGPTTATTLVSIPLCPCPEGQTRDATGRCVAPPPPPVSEDFDCLVLRELAAALAALGILTMLLGICFGAQPMFWLGVAIAAVALVLLVIWLALPCPRPCAWGLLMLAQIIFGIGWGGLYFPLCCPWLGWLGLLLLAIGAGLFYKWYEECATSCMVFRELAWVLTAVVAPVIALLLLTPPLQACGVPIINAVLTIVTAAIVATALACSNSE